MIPPTATCEIPKGKRRKVSSLPNCLSVPDTAATEIDAEDSVTLSSDDGSNSINQDHLCEPAAAAAAKTLALTGVLSLSLRGILPKVISKFSPVIALANGRAI